jgi:hypothetical protein
MVVERYRKFYETYLGPLPEANDQGEIQVRSCFRYDPNPSMFINLEDGRYNDFGGDNGGDAYNFYMVMHEATFSSAKKAVDEIVGASSDEEVASIKVPMPIAEEKVDQWHRTLLSNPDYVNYLTKKRGLTFEVIKRRKLGHDGQRFVIPIYNKFGVCVNVRRYMPGATGGDKMMNFSKGYGGARLYPLEALDRKVVFIQEGEFDSLLQESMGFHALTNTSGAGTWKVAWNELFKDKVVYIWYDKDKAGDEGAQKVAENLVYVAKQVFIINSLLPMPEGTGDDATDWYMKYTRTADDLKEILKEAKPYEAVEDSGSKEHVHRVDLISARDAKYKDKQVEFDVMVVGKDTAPYNIPQELRFTCSSVGMYDKLCPTCQVARCGGESTLRLAKDPDLLELVGKDKQNNQGLIKKKAGIPNQCSAFQIEDVKSSNIEEVLVAPDLQSLADWQADGHKYILQTSYVVDMQTDANRSYRMKGVMTPHPKDQHVTFLITDAEPLQDTISSFKMTKSIHDSLSVFQVKTTIKDKFDEIHSDLIANVTNILGREDLMVGVDLVYHSVLKFDFPNAKVDKGWAEMLCIGDTRTGKTESTMRMMAHYGLGEASAGENVSYAGLVGGLQQDNKRWFLTWGKLPLNDGRLFIIDEASGLREDDIGKMSSIRSSGLAEITKIQTERTTARTRMIWLSNPRSGNHLSAFQYGVEAIPELIGRNEDISRFDFALTADRREVDIRKINKLWTEDDNVDHVYTTELCKTLILWSWSRKPEDIEFSEEAIAATFEYALQMDKDFSSEIPLVDGSNQRIKIAKLAIAAACRTFSTDETGEKVIVTKDHVDFVYDYLEEIYSKPSMDYVGFSEEKLEHQNAVENYRDQVLLFLDKFEAVGELFMRYPNGMYFNSIVELLDTSREAAQTYTKTLNDMYMIEMKPGKGYVVTKAFSELLREWKFQKRKRERSR